MILVFDMNAWMQGTTYVYATFLRPFVARHEPDIDRNLNELRIRAGDVALMWWQRGSVYAQARFYELLQYVASQSNRPQSTIAPPIRPQHPPQIPPQAPPRESNQVPKRVPPQVCVSHCLIIQECNIGIVESGNCRLFVCWALFHSIQVDFNHIYEDMLLELLLDGGEFFLLWSFKSCCFLF